MDISNKGLGVIVLQQRHKSVTPVTLFLVIVSVVWTANRRKFESQGFDLDTAAALGGQEEDVGDASIEEDYLVLVDDQFLLLLHPQRL